MTITIADLSRSRIMDLYARIDAASSMERSEIRRQIESLRVAKATGHGGSARQAGAKRAVISYLDKIGA